MENADDVRLSYRLIRNCQADKQKFCKDVKPGMPRLGSGPAATAGWPSGRLGPAAPHRIVTASSHHLRWQLLSHMRAQLPASPASAAPLPVLAWASTGSAPAAASPSCHLTCCGLRSLHTSFGCQELMQLPVAGGARVKDCLEEHREDAEFSSECKAEFERMMQFRAADFRLDSSLREACASDIEDVCGYEKVRTRAPAALTLHPNPTVVSLFCSHLTPAQTLEPRAPDPDTGLLPRSQSRA